MKSEPTQGILTNFSLPNLSHSVSVGYNNNNKKSIFSACPLSLSFNPGQLFGGAIIKVHFISKCNVMLKFIILYPYLKSKISFTHIK